MHNKIKDEGLEITEGEREETNENENYYPRHAFIGCYTPEKV